MKMKEWINISIDRERERERWGEQYYLNETVEELFDSDGDDIEEGVDAAASQHQDSKVEEAVGVQTRAIERVGFLNQMTQSYKSEHQTLAW